MVYAPHVLYQARGTLPGGEIWSCGLRQYYDGEDFAGLDLQQGTEDALDAWKALFLNVGGAFSPEVTLDEVRGYVYNPGDTLVEQAVSAGAAAAGSGDLHLPNQCTTVATLETATPGRSSRGRIYLPTLGYNIGDAGILSAAETGALALNVAQLVEDMSSAGHDLPVPTIYTAVLSQVTGLAYRITRVSVGDVIDTQRRRTNGIAETRSYAVVGE